MSRKMIRIRIKMMIRSRMDMRIRMSIKKTTPGKLLGCNPSISICTRAGNLFK